MGTGAFGHSIKAARPNRVCAAFVLLSPGTVAVSHSSRLKVISRTAHCPSPQWCL